MANEMKLYELIAHGAGEPIRMTLKIYEKQVDRLKADETGNDIRHFMARNLDAVALDSAASRTLYNKRIMQSVYFTVTEVTA